VSRAFVVSIITIGLLIGALFGVKEYFNYQYVKQSEHAEQINNQRNERNIERTKLLLGWFRNCGFIKMGPDPSPDARPILGDIAIMVDSSFTSCATDEFCEAMFEVLRSRNLGLDEKQRLRVSMVI
jgi:hypothetical protein